MQICLADAILFCQLVVLGLLGGDEQRMEIFAKTVKCRVKGLNKNMIRLQLIVVYCNHSRSTQQ
jgi:hypothetical protein